MPFDIASLYKDTRVLPHIHTLWPHLVLSLSTRFQISIEAEAFEASLKLLLTVSRCSGGEFIAKRLNSDLWPILMRALDQGVSHIEKKNRPLDLLTVKDSNDVEFSSDRDISLELTNTIRIMICETLESIADSADSQLSPRHCGISGAHCRKPLNARDDGIASRGGKNHACPSKG